MKLAVVKSILFMVICSITEEILAGPLLKPFQLLCPNISTKATADTSGHKVVQHSAAHVLSAVYLSQEKKDDYKACKVSRTAESRAGIGTSAVRQPAGLACTDNTKRTPFSQLDNSSLCSRSIVQLSIIAVACTHKRRKRRFAPLIELQTAVTTVKYPEDVCSLMKGELKSRILD